MREAEIFWWCTCRGTSISHDIEPIIVLRQSNIKGWGVINCPASIIPMSDVSGFDHPCGETYYTSLQPFSFRLRASDLSPSPWLGESRKLLMTVAINTMRMSKIYTAERAIRSVLY
ncbi:hypothetical protein EVAR_67828_1 [Eumeta japonica]|uniref:Uncharacterized protein n=1 Tax=Eumeta variegata TaxID=151549 RepID=A0A4C1ZWY9_EUMVA|nr:hypothetical protein EVAR_67828_1 [Eumeta japonica]